MFAGLDALAPDPSDLFPHFGAVLGMANGDEELAVRCHLPVQVPDHLQGRLGRLIRL